MKPRAFALAFVVALALAAPLAATARQGTPIAGAGLATGETVSVVGPDGAELGQVTLEEFTEPFVDYDPNSPPQHGFHYGMARITIENTGPRPLPIHPRQFALLDAHGYLLSPSSVNRGNDPDVPDLPGQDIATGSSVTGMVTFQILNTVPVHKLLYMPANDRSVTVASAPGLPSPAVGETVPIIGAEGMTNFEITVTAVTNPYEEYQPNAAPARGSNYVGLEVTVVNTTPRVVRFDPRSIALLDADGFLYSAANVRRQENATPRDFEYQDALDPGAQATGFIGFQVLSGVQLVGVVFLPGGDRYATLVDLTNSTTG